MLPNVAQKVTLFPPVSHQVKLWSSVSVAHVQFGEDPVTQTVDLVVIKDRSRLHLQNHKLGMFIAQPWTHTFCHPRYSHLVE